MTAREGSEYSDGPVVKRGWSLGEWDECLQVVAVELSNLVPVPAASLISCVTLCKLLTSFSLYLNDKSKRTYLLNLLGGLTELISKYKALRIVPGT